MVDEYDPLWLEFIQSLNKTDMDTALPPNTTQSTVTFDSLLNDDDDDDEEFIGPEDEIHTDQKKLRVSSMSHCTRLLSRGSSICRTRVGLVIEGQYCIAGRVTVSSSSPKPDRLASEHYFHCRSHSNEELLPADQYESLWTDFLASLQHENHHSADEQPKSIVTSTTEDDENDDDPEFHLPDNHYDLEDDLDEELHVSSNGCSIEDSA